MIYIICTEIKMSCWYLSIMVNNRYLWCWRSGRHWYLWCWRLEKWETPIFMVLKVGKVGDTDIYGAGGVGETDMYGAGGWRSGRHRYLWCWRLEEWETDIYGAGGWRSGRHWYLLHFVLLQLYRNSVFLTIPYFVILHGWSHD